MTATATAVAFIATPASETVASFIDREFTQGVFTSGKWNVQGNATGDVTTSSAGWSDHFTAGSAAIFEPAVGAIIPGATRSYARFGLRLAPGSSLGGTVTIPQGIEATTGKADKFRMRVVRATSPTCNSTSFTTAATFVVGSSGTFGTMLSLPTTTGNVHKIPLSPGSPSTNAGAPVYLCYEFSLPALPIAGLSDGDTAKVRWTFDAVSS